MNRMFIFSTSCFKMRNKIRDKFPKARCDRCVSPHHFPATTWETELMFFFLKGLTNDKYRRTVANCPLHHATKKERKKQRTGSVFPFTVPKCSQLPHKSQLKIPGEGGVRSADLCIKSLICCTYWRVRGPRINIISANEYQFINYDYHRLSN